MMSENADATVGQVTAAAKTSGYKELGLAECGKFDMEHHLREKVTGWGRICKDRASKGLSKRGNARRGRRG
jgi:hypothetical protein